MICTIKKKSRKDMVSKAIMERIPMKINEKTRTSVNNSSTSMSETAYDLSFIHSAIQKE